MGSEASIPPPAGELNGQAADLTGQDRMVRNVLISWICHFVFIAGGFVLPRVVDHNLGQDALGVWDFGWSLIGYFNLVQLGISTSVSRYVAKYRSVGDVVGVNSIVSSVSCVFLVVGAIVLGLTAAAVLALPALLSHQLAAFLGDARWVVLFLGASLAVQIVSAGFGGVMTGCHRWDLQNYVYAGSYAATLAAMTVVLFLGGGLPALALVNLCGEVVHRALRVVLAYRVYPPLRPRLALARWSVAKQTVTFGGKSFLPTAAEMLLNQTVCILIFAALGPAALAVYSRPKSLVRHANRLIGKFAYVLMPTAGSLQAMNEEDRLRSLLVKSTRYGAFLALPMVLVLVVLGGPILRIWMGPGYERGLVLAVLAAGGLASMVQMPALSILSGMNAHGRPGLAKLAASGLAVVAAVVAVRLLGWGLLGAAVAVAVPIALVDGIYLPVYTCRRLKLRLSRYLAESLGLPVFCAIPFALCLIGARVLFPARPIPAVASAAAAGAAILTVLYWRNALPQSLKRKIVRRVSPRRPR